MNDKYSVGFTCSGAFPLFILNQTCDDLISMLFEKLDKASKQVENGQFVFKLEWIENEKGEPEDLQTVV